MFAYKDLKNILSNANLPVVLLIFLSTKAKKITPKKKKKPFWGFIYDHLNTKDDFLSYAGAYFHFCKVMVDSYLYNEKT